MNNPLLIVLALSVPSLLTAVVLAVLIIRRKAQERSGVERLLAAVKASEASFRDALAQRLIKDFHCEEESAGQTADSLVKQRRQTYKQVLTALLEREPTALSQLEPSIAGFANAHLKALAALSLHAGKREAPVSVPPSLIPQAPPTDAGEAVLRMENDRLRREVSLTLSTLNNIFAEYASMFGDEQTRRDMSLPEILSAMQHLAEGEQPVAGAVDDAVNAPLSAMTAEPDGALTELDLSQATPAEADAGLGDRPENEREFGVEPTPATTVEAEQNKAG